MPKVQIGRAPAWWLLAATVVAVAAVLLSGFCVLRAGSAEPAQAAEGEVEPIQWNPCGEGREAFDCASFPVPVDHADPFGPEMRLALMRLPSSGAPEDRIGTLFVNPGGPGGDALVFLSTYASKFSHEVLSRFDVVAFNPRGVVGSSPSIECPLPNFVGDDISDWAQFFSSQLGPIAARSTACQLAIARTGPYFGTNQVVEDLELLREAVGDQLLSYWGISYGTRIGEVYAQRYPDRIRAMILDGNVDPYSTGLEFNAERGTGFDEAFHYFLSAYPEAAPAFAEVSTALSTAPMEVLDILTGEATSLTKQSLYAQAIMPIISSEATWPMIAGELVALAEQLHGGPTASVYLQHGTENQATMGVQVNCLDLPDRPSVEVMAAEAEAIVQEAPLFGPYVAVTLSSCNGFATEPDPVPASSPPAGEMPPVLLLASLYDPATPYPWSAAMLSFLPGSVRATYEGVQHGVWNGPSECINSIGDAYIVDLGLPEPDVSCPFVKAGTAGPTHSSP